MTNDIHNRFMSLALQEAQKAAEAHETPVGAVITHKGHIIGRAHNQVELLKDPTAHAEIIAITQAASALGDWRLNDTVLYVTKEPCPMCAGALVLAHINRLVYSIKDDKMGCAGTILNLVQESRFNHQMQIKTGVLESECLDLIQLFFQKLRNK